jgi:lipoyl-dependent peroxiredoxin
MKVLYEAHATASGGRNGRVTTDNGVLAVELAIPKEMGGPGGAKTNPEQLFAAGYAACFDSALNFVGSQKKIRLHDTQVNATVGIGPRDDGGFGLAVRLEVTIPGVSREEALQLLEAAHATCPYSNAVRGNVKVDCILV